MTEEVDAGEECANAGPAPDGPGAPARAEPQFSVAPRAVRGVLFGLLLSLPLWGLLVWLVRLFLTARH